MKFLKLFILALVLFCSSCGNRNAKTVTPETLKEPLISANKKYVVQEADEIEQYIKRHNLDMKKTGTGLRYMIYANGTGAPAQNGKEAKVNYNISLLDGTQCYSSKEKGPKTFLIGQDNVESGLHEGILYMKEGDKAIFILPSHLAHGLLGDENKIPPRSSVVYDIELLKVR